jgi:hypothetical protein
LHAFVFRLGLFARPGSDLLGEPFSAFTWQIGEINSDLNWLFVMRVGLDFVGSKFSQALRNRGILASFSRFLISAAAIRLPIACSASAAAALFPPLRSFLRFSV